MANVLTQLEKHVSLDNTDEVLTYIAGKQVKESYKANMVDYYAHYCDFNGIKFSKPKYHRDHKIDRSRLAGMFVNTKIYEAACT